MSNSFTRAEIRPAKLVPLGEDQQRRRAIERVVIALRVVNALAENLSRFCHRLGIEGLHLGAGAEQAIRSQ